MSIVVAAGDTLSSLALRHLGDPQRWYDLWRLNKSRIVAEQRRCGANPKCPADLIYVGMRLQLPAK